MIMSAEALRRVPCLTAQCVGPLASLCLQHVEAGHASPLTPACLPPAACGGGSCFTPHPCLPACLPAAAPRPGSQENPIFLDEGQPQRHKKAKEAEEGTAGQVIDLS